MANFKPDWIDHDGTHCPFEVGTVLLVRMRCGEEIITTVNIASHLPCIEVGDAMGFNAWMWAVNGRRAIGEHFDIVAYKLQGVPDEEVYRHHEEPVHECV